MDINALIAMMTGGGGGQADPHNQQVPGMPPLPIEDSEQDGYWDAKNRGNGKGQSFQMQGGKQIPADPVGLPPEIEELLAMIGPAAASNPPSTQNGLEQGASRMEDPVFAAAKAAWTQENGTEPATDGEFADVEEWAAEIEEAIGGDLGKLEAYMKQR